jgi:integrase
VDQVKRAPGSGTLSPAGEGRWRIRVRLADGARASKVIAAESREHAEQQLNAVVYELVAANQISTGSPTLRALGEKFLDEREIGKAAAAHERQVWRNHVLDEAFGWADWRVSAITRADCERWLEYLEDKKAKRPSAWKKGGQERYFDRTLSKQTRIHCRNVIKTFFAWCVKKNFVRESPATALEVRATRTDHEREDAWTFLSAAEIEQVRTCEGIPAGIRDLLLFAVYTGMRQGELWGLRWRDIELDGRMPRVTVRRSHDRSTKSKRARPFPLFAPAVEILQRQRARVRSTEPDALVWPDDHGEQREEQTDAGWRDRVAEKGRRIPGWKTVAGIYRRVRFHDLRHTCASHLVMGTWGRAWSLQEVQKFIGHTSIETTQRYAHLSPEHLHSAAAQTLAIVVAPPSAPEQAPTQDAAPTPQPIENTPQRSAVGPVEAHVGPDLGPSEFGPPANCAESEDNSERATGFEPATASLGSSYSTS